MKIEITSMCSLMGRPLSVGETVETTNEAEEEAARYLISIEKAKEIVEVSVVEAADTVTEEDGDSTLTPDPSPEGRGE